MPVRTSTVVALGLILLTVVGVGAIFGNTILAVVAPAAPPAPATPGRPAPSTPSATSAHGMVPGPAAPPAAKDGSS